MAAAEDRSGESRPEASQPRRARRQSQREFELEFLARVLERDPYYVEALRVHGNNLAATGQHLRALAIDRRLVRLWPERAVPWYNLACTYAVLGMLDPAFAALQRSLELGYRHLRHLSRDPDLRALRLDPRFPRMLRKLLGSDS